MEITGNANKAKFNYAKLKGLILEKGYTHADLALKIPMNPASFSRKLNGHGEFRQSEIQIITQTLGLKPSSIPTYFFAQ